MAEFTADTAQLESIAGQLKSLGSHIDGVASQVYSTSQGVGSLKSLKNKGYVGMIHDVRTSLRTIADDTSLMSSRLSQTAEAYAQTEDRVVGIFTLQGVSGKTAHEIWGSPAYFKDQSLWGVVKKAFGDIVIDDWEVLSPVLPNSEDIRDVSQVIEDFHRWRATKGSDIAKDIYKKASAIPGLKELLKSIVKDANEKVSDYENVLYGVLNPTNIDALAKGADSFAGLLGFDWIGKVATRAKNQTDYYNEKGAKQVAEGHVVEGIFTAVGGSLLAFGDMAIDTSVKTLKWVVKEHPVVKAVMELPGVKQVVDVQTKITKKITKAFTGKAYETVADAVFGSIGDGVKGVFDRFTNWGRKK